LREWNGPKQCLIYQQTLVGFEGNAFPIPLEVKE
jgi:hypothetical protein